MRSSSASLAFPTLAFLVAATLTISSLTLVGGASGWKECMISPEDKWKQATQRTPALRMRYDYERRYTCEDTQGVCVCVSGNQCICVSIMSYIRDKSHYCCIFKSVNYCLLCCYGVYTRGLFLNHCYTATSTYTYTILFYFFEMYVVCV